MEENGDCLNVSSEKKGLGGGGGVKFSKLKLFRVPRTIGPKYTHTHTHTHTLDNVLFLKMEFRDYKESVLKMEEEKIYYTRQVPSAHSAIGFICKVNIWNIVFKRWLNPQSGQLSTKFYSCVICPASVSCPNEDQPSGSESASLVEVLPRAVTDLPLCTHILSPDPLGTKGML